MVTYIAVMRHSTKKMENALLVHYDGKNRYIVRFADGVECYAIFNPFSMLYYADDLYALVE